MKKAFIFDMDGVIINSEIVWQKYEKDFLTLILGEEIASKIGDTIGATVHEIYDKAVLHGLSLDKKEYLKKYDRQVKIVYANANISPGIERLIQSLKNMDFKIGIATSSRTKWIAIVKEKLPLIKEFDAIVSIGSSKNLKPKPDPSSYLAIIKKLQVDSERTIVLEDSNRGIQAGKAAGAYVIGFKGNLTDGYKQAGANIYADTMDDVIKIVEARNALL